MDDLRTPSVLYNHGGYYSPAECNMPGGPCSACSDRAECMEPCPACGKTGTYKTHSAHGYSQCRGCEEKICSDCAHGARYTCAFFQAKMRLPLERQLSEDKWESAETYMKANPTERVFEVATIGRHVYLLVRLASGRLLRIHAVDEM